MILYYFSGKNYIRHTDTQNTPYDAGYPASIANWDWGSFGSNGIDAALYSGSKCYFFSGALYIRVTRGATGAGTIDPGYPTSIANWGWGDFGRNGIDAAMWSGPKCYFFSGPFYIRVTRGDTGAGTIDPGYPAPIANWGWGDFGKNGIDAACYFGEGNRFIFFSGSEFLIMNRGEFGPGTIEHGSPAPISAFRWGAFGDDGIDAALNSGTPDPFTKPPGQQPPTQQPPPATMPPSILCGVQFSADLQFKILRIRGEGFQPNETVDLVIIVTIGTNAPEADGGSTVADRNGLIDYSYSGGGGGVCSADLTPWQFQVTGTGLTSLKISNTALARC